MDEQQLIPPIEEATIIEVKRKPPAPIFNYMAEADRALKASQQAMALAEEHKIVITPEPTMWGTIKDKLSFLNNSKSDPSTTTVGFGAALVSYYEALSYFIEGNTVLGVVKIAQGTFALAVGIISKDPQSFFQPK